MAIYDLVYLPDPRLRAETASVTDFGPEFQTLVDDMIETMDHANGVGLAAPQIGISLRLAVIDVTRERNQRLCLANPEIVEIRGTELMEEGCLSVPGTYDKAPRPLWVKMKAQDRHGKPYEIETDGLLAHAISHEIDHLNGKLFIDYLSSLKRQMARKKVEKHLRRQE